MRVSLSVLGKVNKHGVLRCINKKVVHVFHREGSYRPPPPGWIGLMKKCLKMVPNLS